MESLKLQYNKYSTYKDSGVVWLGIIPKGWHVLHGVNFIFEGKEKNIGMKRNTVLSLSYGKIREKKEEELTGLVPESFETYQLINEGDIIFRPTDLQNDKVSLRSSISEFEGIITSAYLNLRFKETAYPKYYHYFFRAIDNNKVIYGLGSGLRQNIDFRDFRRFYFPFPPFSEQTAIANFLDNKTTKIDLAITQKEKMIALLKERKQIIIQNAVTKGLDKTVEFKDSGVEMIGKIPYHWKVNKLKFICTMNVNSLPENTDSNFEFKYVDIGSVTLENGITRTDSFIFKDSPSRARRIAKKGDIIISTVRTYLKAIDFIDDSKCEYIFSTGFAVLQPSKIMHPEFLANFVSCDAFTEQVTINSKGMSYPAINSTDLGRLIVVHGNKEEQKLIALHIQNQSLKINKAINLQQTQIAKLKEYQATLIDSAVTGKIKVI